MQDLIKMTVTMEVTEAQAITLKEMFETWNYLGNVGSSRFVCFLADGDGNFHPNVKVKTDRRLTELTKEERQTAYKYKDDIYKFDFDNIAWLLRDKISKNI